eukprot:TRINITY_DN17026_c0_g1_i4.p1 TRINITY_DN17026_c0_g1~~TRINITY_DN17026_c0_g1_i4.p1  ORF type:complete len:927 (+),score=130.99 TRINITY_DN17026_c0_g1_i4:126-2906(+)
MPAFHGDLEGIPQVCAAQSRLEDAVAGLTAEVGMVVLELRSIKCMLGGASTLSNEDIDMLAHLPVPAESNANSSEAELIECDVGPGQSLLPEAVAYKEIPKLPDAWPIMLRSRQALEESNERACRVSGSFSRLNVVCANSRRQYSDSAHAVGATGDATLAQRCVMHPNSRLRMFIDCCTLVIMIYELWLTPLLVAWELSLTGVPLIFNQFTATFWTIDLALTFVTGFYHNGDLKMRHRHIALHYLRSWLIPDLAVVACDWMGLFMSDSSLAGFRMVRFIRMLRMLRVVRLARVLEALVDAALSETVRVLMRLLSILMAILMFNHFMCCGWIALGKYAPTDTGSRWIDVLITLGREDHAYLDLNTFYQYFTVYHWYLSQMSIGNEVIYCFNTFERVYNIMGILVGLMISSCLISTFSAIMIDLGMAKQDQKTKLRTLNRFLLQENIDQMVSIQIRKQVLERIHQKDRITERSVAALELLSSSLRKTLRFQIFRSHLTTHPLFKVWTGLDVATVEYLCDGNIEFVFLLPQDDLFVAATDCDDVYFTVSGSLYYIQEPDSSPVNAAVATQVDDKVWLSEAAFWCHWVHVGTATASEAGQVCKMGVEGVLKTSKRHAMIREMTRAYGTAFHRSVVGSVPPTNQWPSDLHVDFTEFEELVLALPQHMQEVVGMMAIEEAEALAVSKKRGKLLDLAKLKDEVIQGTCTLLSVDDEIRRIVSVCVLHLRRSDGRTFFQLGKLEEGKLVPNCQLPGQKQGHEVSGSEGFSNYLKLRLKPLEDCLKIESMERDVKWQRSATHGLRTKYLRYIYHATLSKDFQMQSYRSPEGLDVTRLTRTKRSSTSSVNSMSSGSKENPLEAELQRQMAAKMASRLADIEVYDIGDFTDGEDTVRRSFYAWLTQEQVEFLNSSLGKIFLGNWLQLIYHQEEDPDA